MHRARILWTIPFLVLPATAQEAESNSLGLQGRISIPQAGLQKVAGGSDFSVPGLGLSLVAEVDLSEGFRGRLDLGGDRWLEGKWEGRPGVNAKVSSYHVALEGVYMLRPEESPSWGPYVVGGLGAYAWSIGSEDTSAKTSTTQRTMHVAGTLGIGFRISRFLDLEVRALGGRIDPTLFAAAIQASVTFRY